MEVKGMNSINYPIVANVYEASDEYVIASVGSANRDSKECVENKKPRKYKAYYDDKKDDYYFVKDGRKFYMGETLRV